MSTKETSTPKASSPVLHVPSGAISPVPQLGDGFQDSNFSTGIGSPGASEVEDDASKNSERSGVRKLFRFGKRKEDKTTGKNKAGLGLHGEDTTSISDRANLGGSPPLPATSPSHPNHPYQYQASPSRNLHSSSSRVASPAGSQIFERDVQEGAVPMPNSPAIPAHIQTEDHIPSVLDASSEAITNSNLDPDSVEIVMHSAHQPAAVPVTGVGSGESMTSSFALDSSSQQDKEDTASNYTAIGNSDVRRLSFISFADVVQSEHAEHTGVRDTTHVTGRPSLSSGHRSPSPMRSPVSSQGFETSPPTSKSASVKGVELSPTRSGRPLGSPTASIASMANPAAGELTIETMSQALKKSGSGDLSGSRSQPMSPPISEGYSERIQR
ncbi:MAG: hypothetical protein M1818_002651 [Claussenomyces sp. TS43310]|nr:MAG: hypothetical protein M1818_002651 [Claussenomyces sp. TS43310]